MLRDKGDEGGKEEQGGSLAAPAERENVTGRIPTERVLGLPPRPRLATATSPSSPAHP
jgi:hypothetical protein